MDYQYHCQVHADIRRKRIIPIPENCVIAPEYLNGLDNAGFVSAFAAIQNIALGVYDDMVGHPGEYGLKLTPIGEKDGTLNLVGRFGCLLCNFGLLGEMNGRELVVPIDGFRKVMGKHNKFMYALSRLTGFGFTFGNLVGRGFAKDATTFTVTYPGNPDVIPALKGYAVAAGQARAAINPGMLMYMDDLYGCFYYRLVEDAMTQRYERMFLIMTDNYSEEGRAIAYWLHDQASSRGYGYASTYSPIGNHVSFSKGSKGFLGVNEHLDTKIPRTRLILRKVLDQRIDLIHALPERFQDSFRKSTCTRCNGNSAPQLLNVGGKTCGYRICYEYEGEKREGCAYHSFHFDDIKLGDMQQLLEIALLENDLR